MQATHKALVSTSVPNAPERVSDLMDATQEQMDDAQEVADVVGGAAQPVADEDEVDKEMALLFEQSLDFPELSSENISPEPQREKTPEKDNIEEMAKWVEL
jgi:hypothetical protein